MRNRPKGDFSQVNCSDISKLFARPIFAYNFYQRNTFEEIPEKALVKRVQTHISALKIPILDLDVAQMLQYAADKVPIEEAVEKHLRAYVQKIRLSEPGANGYSSDGFMWDTPLFIQKLQETRVDGGPADRSKLKDIFGEMNKDREAEGRAHWNDRVLKNLEGTFDTDAKLDLFLERCAEPLVRAELGDQHAATALEVLIDAGELKTLLGLAAKQGKEQCSWEATIGPAVKALKRLGRTSAGKDMEKLAGYSKAPEAHDSLDRDATFF